MNAQQLHIDTIANNLANVNTTGFKKNRVDFEDLIYQHQVLAGTPATSVSEIPVGVNVGHGVKAASTQKILDMGALMQTKNTTDLAVNGEVGYFKVQLPDNTFAYTRDGTFHIDSKGQFVTSDGLLVQPPILVPPEAKLNSFSVSEQGLVTVVLANETVPTQIGQMELYRFANPQGLKAIGKNLLVETPASGGEIAGTPSLDGFSSLLQGFLEMSNVNLAEEMVSMIVAQRAYESNSKAIQTSDSMLATAIQLKR